MSSSVTKTALWTPGALSLPSSSVFRERGERERHAHTQAHSSMYAFENVLLLLLWPGPWVKEPRGHRCRDEAS